MSVLNTPQETIDKRDLALCFLSSFDCQVHLVINPVVGGVVNGRYILVTECPPVVLKGITERFRFPTGTRDGVLLEVHDFIVNPE